MSVNVKTFQHLQQIRDKFGPGIFGKIIQKLLALAFYEIGSQHVVERGVQGVDIDVVITEAQKYTFEVKTTEGEGTLISKENIDDLRDRQKDGYRPVLAVLRIQLFEDWIFASVPLSHLHPGTVPLSRLRAYRLKELEISLYPIFERVVDQHFSSVLERGEGYLLEVLSQKRGDRIV